MNNKQKPMKLAPPAPPFRRAARRPRATHAFSSVAGSVVSVRTFLLIASAAVMALAACTTDEPGKEGSGGGGEAAAPVTNRIDIPASVVRNLGIRFAKADRRRVDRTMRMPGVFEVLPEAERDYRVPVDGRISLQVSQYQTVALHDVIAYVESPAWRTMQAELNDGAADAAERTADWKTATAEREAAEAALASYPQRIAAYNPHMKALQEHHRKLEAKRDQWQARVSELEELASKGAARSSEIAEARGNLADAETELSGEEEAHAELQRLVTELRLDEARDRSALQVLHAREAAARNRAEAAEKSFQLKLAAAAASLGLSLNLLENDAWRALGVIPIRAQAPGVVLDLHVSENEWLDAGTSFCHILDVSRLRFRARALQADLGKLKNGLPARIVPPAGGTLETADAAEGAIALAPMADGDSRLLDVIVVPVTVPAWARPGISAELEVVWDQSGPDELAVPSKALIRDGLDTVMFVRDVSDPEKVIRTVVETGASDGRWTVVYQGVMKGSEVVVEGTYELKLTGSGKPLGEGHFHADGTWHAGKHSDDE